LIIVYTYRVLGINWLLFYEIIIKRIGKMNDLLTDTPSRNECNHDLIDPSTSECKICHIILERGISVDATDFDDIKYQRRIRKSNKLYPRSLNLTYGNDVISKAEQISSSMDIFGSRKDMLALRRAHCIERAMSEFEMIFDPESIYEDFGVSKGKRSGGNIFASIESGYRPPSTVARRCFIHPSITMMRAKGKKIELLDEAIEGMIHLIQVGLSYKHVEGTPKYNLRNRKPVTVVSGAINAYLQLNPTVTINKELYTKHIKVSPPTIKDAKEEIIRAFNSYVPT
jgi:hypothetical protein